jgi:alcohol dehydrogenase (cytochrome c)
MLDRTDGTFLRAFPFARQTWASGIGEDGRPIEIPGQRPSPQGTLTCPDLYGGTNFMSPSFDPGAGLFFVTAREVCQIYISEAPPAGYPGGERTMGGRVRAAPERGWGALRALDPFTGKLVWEIRHETQSWSGVLSTAGGVVFGGDGQGVLLAADTRTGRELWRYPMGAALYAAPTTYMIDGRQYVSMAAGSTFVAFALPAR